MQKSNKMFKRELRFKILKPWKWFRKLEVKLPFYRNKLFGSLFNIDISLEKTATDKWSVFIFSEERDIFYNKPFDSKKEAKRFCKQLIEDNYKLWDELQQYHAFYGGLKYKTKFDEEEPWIYHFNLTEDEIKTLAVLDDEIINTETINSFKYESEAYYTALGFINCMKLSMQRKEEHSEKNNKAKNNK